MLAGGLALERFLRGEPLVHEKQVTRRLRPLVNGWYTHRDVASRRNRRRVRATSWMRGLAAALVGLLDADGR